ncbi:MAG: hypothetical protein JSU08_11250 [Acidobacteria bacterium]|nr:hypothetical protein [Acidobacteriota bacterium]
MPMDLTPEELNYIKAALTLVLAEREELIETGRLSKELGEETVVPPMRESATYEETLRTILSKLQSA